LSRRLLQLTP